MQIDRVGHRYGNLTIEKRLEDKINGRIVYEARCDCGNLVNVWSFSNDPKKMRKSCGCNKDSRLDLGRSNFNTLMNVYRRNAKRRGFEFSLSSDEFYNITISNCYYCDSPPSNIRNAGGKRNGAFIYNGIDRVNPSIGYIHSNVVPCCSRCNTAKMRMSKDEFFCWIKSVYDRFFFDVGKQAN